MTEQRVRSRVFGEAAEAYDAARPGYPAELVDDVLAFAAAGVKRAGVGRVVEAGAGTGKATTAFAARGLALTGIEADPRMAEVLTRKCSEFPDTTIVVSRFEDWPGDAASVDLLFSAQAWHWLDPATRWDRAARMLAPGGALAVWWNGFSLSDDAYRTELHEAHVRHGVPELAEVTLGRDHDSGHTAGQDDWPHAELLAHPDFQDVEFRAYERAIAFSPRSYTDLVQSMSAYRMLEDDARDRLLDDLAAAVASHGEVVLTVSTRLYLARTRIADSRRGA